MDLVETGTTLAQNGLEVIEVVTHVSSVLVANRAAYKLKQDRIKPLIENLRKAVETAPRKG